MQRVDTKVVIRRLPPHLTEDEFKAIVDPLPPHRYFRFAIPDPSLQGFSCCTVYIHFSNPNALFQFVERFDGYVFVDSKGNEAVCYVERAMNQKSPPLPSQIDLSTDAKRNTLHTRKAYQDFLVMYEKRKSALESGAEPYTAMDESTNATSAPSTTTTPVTAANDSKPSWEKNLEEIRAREKEIAEGKYAQKSTLVEYMNDRFARLHADRDRRSKERTGKEVPSSKIANAVSGAATSDKQAVPSTSASETVSKVEKDSSKKPRKGEKDIKPLPPPSLSATNKTAIKDPVKKPQSDSSSRKGSLDNTTLNESFHESTDVSTTTVDEEKRRKIIVVLDKSSRPPATRKNAEHYVNEYQTYYGRSNDNSYGYRGSGKYKGSSKISQYWAPPPSEKGQENDAPSSTSHSKNVPETNHGNDDYVEDERGNYFSSGKDNHSSWSGKDDYYYQYDDEYEERDWGPQQGYYYPRGGGRPPSYKNYSRGGHGFYRNGPRRSGRGYLRGRGDGPPSYSASRRYES